MMLRKTPEKNGTRIPAAEAIAPALAVTGLAGASAAVMPIEKAIELHKIRPERTLSLCPRRAIRGQQNALQSVLKKRNGFTARYGSTIPDCSETVESG
jgi:hypothetical protein